MACRLPGPLGRTTATNSAPIHGFGNFTEPGPLDGCSPNPKVEYTLPTIGFGQRTFMSCWFASYSLMYAWSASENDSTKCRPVIRKRLTDAGFDVTRTLRDGINSKEAKEAGGILSFTGIKGTTFKTAHWTSIMAVMEDRGPMWCGWGNHVLILAGMEVTPKQVTVKYYDPYHPTNPGVADVGWSSLEKFLDEIRTHEYAVQFLEHSIK